MSGLISRDAVRRAVRTFLIAFVAIAVPGFLGWLHGLTEWANTQGQAAFPDGHQLVYLVTSAIVAGVVALLNLVVVAVEDWTGKGLLRTPRPVGQHVADERGAASAGTVLKVVTFGLGAVFSLIGFLATLAWALMTSQDTADDEETWERFEGEPDKDPWGSVETYSRREPPVVKQFPMVG